MAISGKRYFEMEIFLFSEKVMSMGMRRRKSLRKFYSYHIQ